MIRNVLLAILALSIFSVVAFVAFVYFGNLVADHHREAQRRLLLPLLSIPRPLSTFKSWEGYSQICVILPYGGPDRADKKWQPLLSADNYKDFKKDINDGHDSDALWGAYGIRDNSIVSPIPNEIPFVSDLMADEVHTDGCHDISSICLAARDRLVVLENCSETH